MLDAKTILNAEIANSLINVGIPTNTQGFQFLKESISMVIEKPTYLLNLTKKMYPEIAKKFNSTSFVVERSIRHAIEVSYQSDGLYGLNDMLKTTYYIGKDKPCNGYFIGLLAEIIKTNYIKNALSNEDENQKSQLDDIIHIFNGDYA